MNRPILNLITSMGNLASLGAIVTLIVVYGNLPKSVADTVKTVESINSVGSVRQQRHEALNDQWEKTIERRLEILEATYVNAVKIQADVEWIKKALGGKP